MQVLEKLEFINEAFNIANSICIKYRLLKTLDLMDVKSQIIFENNKKSLMYALKQEQELYDKYSFSVSDYEQLIDICVKTFNLNSKISFEESISDCNEFKPEKRVLCRIISMNSFNNKNRFQIQKDKLPDFVTKSLSDDEIKRQVDAHWAFQYGLLHDYYLVFLAFLEEKIEKEENNNIKEKLVHIKYLVPFIYMDIEEEFIKNNFQTPKVLYLKYKMIADIKKIPELFQDINISTIIYHKFCVSGDMLLRITDDEFEKKTSDILLYSFLIKSASIFLDELLLAISKKEFLDTISIDDTYQNKQKAIKVLTQIYDNANKDKEIHQTLSLKPSVKK